MDKEKIGLFLRVPKNASTSILNGFKENNYILKSNSLKDLCNVYKGAKNKKCVLYSKTSTQSRLILQHSKALDLKGVFSFGFVRNPYSRVVSSFNLHSNRGLVNSWRGGKKRKDFKQYLKILEKQNLNPHTNFQSIEFLLACEQYPFLIDDDNSIKVDFIGRVENIQNDIDFVTKTLGLNKVNIPHLNKTSVKNYVEYYDDECKEIVTKIYKKDIEYFNYEFKER